MYVYVDEVIIWGHLGHQKLVTYVRILDQIHKDDLRRVFYKKYQWSRLADRPKQSGKYSLGASE